MGVREGERGRGGRRGRDMESAGGDKAKLRMVKENIWKRGRASLHSPSSGKDEI